jgi:hypothetical protein
MDVRRDGHNGFVSALVARGFAKQKKAGGKDMTNGKAGQAAAASE